MLPLLAIPQVELDDTRVDGVRDEAGWEQALHVDGFTVFAPSPDAPPVGDTDVWLVASRHALHVFIEAHDPQPERVRASLGRRDTRWEDDWVGLYLDTSGKAQRAWLVASTPRGVQLDGLRVAGQEDDDSVDLVYTTAGHPTDDGYVVEMEIPWRSARHPRTVDPLGVVLVRHVARTGEQSSWPRLDPDIQGLLVQAAELEGPGRLPATAGLDVVGEVTWRTTESGPPTFPIATPVAPLGISPGATLRFQPAPALSVLATVNPDFSQVEADQGQIDVNQRFALYYPETRLFFLDGREWFVHPFGELFYSRTVGAPLIGDRVTLEAGAISVAALHAVDSAPTPSVSEGGGWTEDQLDGRVSDVVVGRVRSDLGDDGHVGVFASDRTVFGSDLANRVAGVDTRLRISEGTTASASALGSSTVFADGEQPKWGAAGSAMIDHSARVFGAGASGKLISPDFRAENGFVTRADFASTQAWGSLSAYPGGWLPRVRFEPLYGWTTFSTTGTLREAGLGPSTTFVLGNGMFASVGGTWGGEDFGGTWLDTRRAYATVAGAPTRWLSGDVGGHYGVAPYFDPAAPRQGWRAVLNGSVNIQATPSVIVGGTWRFERFEELDHELLYTGVVGRIRGDLALSRTLFARTLLDVSTFDDTRRADLLLAWERTPGTGAYLGGSTTLVGDPSWTVFAKVSGALRL